MYLSESKLFLPFEVKSLICESKSGSTCSGSAFAAAAAAPAAAPVAVFPVDTSLFIFLLTLEPLIHHSS